jgi:hypothetical protein
MIYSEMRESLEKKTHESAQAFRKINIRPSDQKPLKDIKLPGLIYQ